MECYSEIVYCIQCDFGAREERGTIEKWVRLSINMQLICGLDNAVLLNNSRKAANLIMSSRISQEGITH